MLLIDTIASLAASRVTAWQSQAGALLLGFMGNPANAQLGSSRGLAARLRELRADTSRQLAPADDVPLWDACVELIERAQLDAGAELDAKRSAALHDATELGVAATGAFLRDALRMDEQSVLQAARNHVLSSLYSKNRGVLDFRARDASGRMRRTENLTDTAVRKLLVDTYTHALLLTLKQSGHDLAQVLTGGEWAVFSISGKTAGRPTLEEVEYLIHPNLRAMVRKA